MATVTFENVCVHISFLFHLFRHLNAIFENILFHDSEFLPLDGFKTAMKTMGVRSYDPCPDQLVRGYVDRQTFCTEA